MQQIACCWLVLLLALPGIAGADERIRSFHADIYVNTDGSLQVVETITVRAERDRIRRGIYRDFPTTYQDHLGNRYRVDFQVMRVLRDGRDENYFTASQSNGVRTYFGREDVILAPGEYTYTFSYRTDRQLGFFEDHDELYWNVTGNSWEFPIDRAGARVYLPAAVPPGRVTAEAYTGAAGARGREYSVSRAGDGAVMFETTRSLATGQGLSIVVGWPKGYIHEPTPGERLGYFYQDNRHVVLGAAGLALVLLYYALAWRLVGRDPDPGVVITRYQPPPGYSPASLRFIGKMGYDRACFAAAIINLAVKGFLRIKEDGGEYTLERTGDKPEMAPGEAALVKKLFGGSWTRGLRQTNHTWIREALAAHEASLERDYEKKYFLTHSGWFAAGLLLTLAVLVGALLMTPDLEQAGGSVFILIWLTIWSSAVFFLARSAVLAWRRADHFLSVGYAVQMTIFAVLFGGMEVAVFIAFGEWLDWRYAALILAGAGINWLFYELLKAPTRAGGRLLGEVAGFRQFLEVAEKDELDARYPGGRTPALFESFLPYALALGVGQAWAEKFADVLAAATAGGAAGYTPVWYSGRDFHAGSAMDFPASLARGVSGAIAASSSPPGSGSGGGGGGGSSGGGGGGGGGGGW